MIKKYKRWKEYTNLSTGLFLKMYIYCYSSVIERRIKMEASKKQLIKELREYLDKAEKDETTYCELLMEIPQLLKDFNCD